MWRNLNWSVLILQLFFPLCVTKATVLSCSETLSFLAEDCSAKNFKKIRQVRLKKDIKAANSLWKILSEDKNLMTEVRSLARVGTRQVRDLVSSDEISPAETLSFLTTKTKGLEIWQDTDNPNNTELMKLSTRGNLWWSLDKIAAFFRLYFEFHKYFARYFMAKNGESSLPDAADFWGSSRDSNGNSYISLSSYFINSYIDSENYRRIPVDEIRINPYDKKAYKLRRLSPKSPPGFIQKLLRFAKRGAISDYSLEKNSVTAKMNLLYGLPDGSDISGTFINNSWVIRKLTHSRAGWFEKLDCYLPKCHSSPRNNQIPLSHLHILLLTALVGQFHHTFNEVALILGLNNLADYRIGKYSSILSDTVPEAYRALNLRIRAALDMDELQHEPAFFARNSTQKVCKYSFVGLAKESPQLIDRFFTVNSQNYSHFISLPDTFMTLSEMKKFLITICNSNSNANEADDEIILNTPGHQSDEAFSSM